MEEGTWRLWALSGAMFFGSFVSGLVPLAMSLSESNMKAVTTVGAGLLVGTALAVIIPEGVHTLYTAEIQKMASVGSGEHGHSASAKRVLMAINEQAAAVVHEVVKEGAHEHNNHDHVHGGHSHGDHIHIGGDAHSYIGPMLCIGFVFMLLIDQLGGGNGHSHSTPTGHSPESEGSNRRHSTTTVGLVVHAAADGIALGAAATTRLEVEIVVFLAIMLHKAPAAFGLTSFLLHEGVERTRIRKHLLIFSLAAPVLALLTYFSLSQQNKMTIAHVDATGLGMLFSAGTFLYVATMHVLPGITSNPSANNSSLPGDSSQSAQGHSHMQMSRRQLVLLTIGILLPLVLSYGHHH